MSTSVKDFLLSTSGFPATPHRKPTAMTRVQGAETSSSSPISFCSTAHLAAASRSDTPSAAPGFPLARHRKVRMLEMEQVLEGPKVVSVVPRVMPSATAQSMALAKGESAATSVNLGAAGVSAGFSSRAPGFTYWSWSTFFLVSKVSEEA